MGHVHTNMITMMTCDDGEEDEQDAGDSLMMLTAIVNNADAAGCWLVEMEFLSNASSQ